MTEVAPAEQRLVDRFSRVLIGAVAVVSDEQGRVIFIRQPRGPFAGAWLLPGGGLELDESALDAARRETLEETGVNVPDLEFLGTYEVLGNWAYGAFHFVLLAFAGHVASDAGHGGPGGDEGEMSWAYPHEVELHPTGLMILSDSGVATFEPDHVQTTLAAASIRMTRYR